MDAYGMETESQRAQSDIDGGWSVNVFLFEPRARWYEGFQLLHSAPPQVVSVIKGSPPAPELLCCTV